MPGLDEPTLEQRVELLERKLELSDGRIDALWTEMHEHDRRVRNVAVAEANRVEALTRELAQPHRWAFGSAWLILLGVVMSAVGGVLALSH